jgi:hypothetical protein
MHCGPLVSTPPVIATYLLTQNSLLSSCPVSYASVAVLLFCCLRRKEQAFPYRLRSRPVSCLPLAHVLMFGRLHLSLSPTYVPLPIPRTYTDDEFEIDLNPHNKGLIC